MNVNAELTIKKAIENFLSFCKFRCLSSKTYIWYEQKLDCFNNWIKKINIKDIVIEDLRNFISYVQQEKTRTIAGKDFKLSNYTINGYIEVIKALFSFLISEEYIKVNPAVKLTKIRFSEKVIETFSEEQIKALFKAIEFVYPYGKIQRCWAHKSRNVLNVFRKKL